MIKIISNSSDETEQIGEKIGEKLTGTEVIALFGGLGMGKTAFTRGLCSALGINEGVSSPTFALVNEYSGKFKVYHFDMYRVDTWDDLYSTGFFDYIGNGILVIEWSEKILEVFPENTIFISLERNDEESRKISFTNWKYGAIL